jgi:hypothetical protein
MKQLLDLTFLNITFEPRDQLSIHYEHNLLVAEKTKYPSGIVTVFTYEFDPNSNIWINLKLMTFYGEDKHEKIRDYYGRGISKEMLATAFQMDKAGIAGILRRKKTRP